jgi:hypothetical protein
MEPGKRISDGGVWEGSDDGRAEGGWESTDWGLRRFGRWQSQRRLRADRLRSEKVWKMAEMAEAARTMGSLKADLTEMVHAKISLKEPLKACWKSTASEARHRQWR